MIYSIKSAFEVCVFQKNGSSSAVWEAMTGVNDVDNVGQVLPQTLLFGFYYFLILILWISIFDRCVILMHQVVSFDGKTELDFWESEECN